MGDLLSQCGVTATSLTPAEGEALDQRGFVVLEDVTDLSWRRQVCNVLQAGLVEAGEGKEQGTRHLGGLLARDPVFERVLVHPRVLAAVHHVLQRPFRLFQLGLRDPTPGYGQQGLHADWPPRMAGDPPAVVTVLWLLDAFTEQNGATRVVPGSHRIPRPLAKSMQSPQGHHPDECLVHAPAGAALAFDGFLWHSGTRNQSQGPRRVIQSQWVARDSVAPTAPREPCPEHASPVVKALLGH